MLKFRQILLGVGIVLGVVLSLLSAPLLASAATSSEGAPDVNSLQLVIHIKGIDRYQTAAQIAEYGWKTTSDNAVLAIGTDEHIVDALTAAPLAKAKAAPILLTEGDALNPYTATELQRLKVKTVYLVTGLGVFQQNVLDRLAAMNIKVVSLGGVDRFATALNIANQLGSPTQVTLVTAWSNADALSIASVAAAYNMPILLTNVDSLPTSASDYLLAHKGTIQTIYIIGGPGVVSNAIQNTLPNSIRVAGADRYATNLAVFHQFSSQLKPQYTFLASGNDAHLVDALTGAPLAAVSNSGILLTSDYGFMGLSIFQAPATTPSTPAGQSVTGGSSSSGSGGGHGGNRSSVVTNITVSGASSVAIPASGSTTTTYSAIVYDQNNQAMNGQTIAWSLKTPVSGVNINSSSGVVTVADTTTGSAFTVVAKDGSVQGTKDVTLTSTLPKPVVTNITVSGASPVAIPSSGSTTTTYSAIVYDQNGQAMSDQTIAWSLTTPVSGVDINSSTGAVTVADTATGSAFTVVAMVGNKQGTMTVTLTSTQSDRGGVVTSITVSGASSVAIPTSGSTTTTYSAIVYDQNGQAMSDQTVTWSLVPDPSVEGVNINSNTGEVTIAATTTGSAFTVVATDGKVTGTMPVALQFVTSITVSGASSVVVPTSGSTTTTYSAIVYDQNNSPIDGQTVTWSLDPNNLVDGVNINSNTGEVTIAATTTGSAFTVVATDGKVTGTKPVALQFVTSITVSGANSVAIIPKSESKITTFSAIVYDQNNNPIEGQTVTWSLDPNNLVAGVNIDSSTGEVTMADTTTGSAFTVVATDGKVTGTKPVKLRIVTSITVSGVDLVAIPTGGSTTTTFTAIVYDQNNLRMKGQTVTWSLETPVAGVNIDSSTGEVTIAATTTGSAFTVVAMDGGSVSGQEPVTLYIPVATSITVIGAKSVDVPTSGFTTTTYSAIVNDQNGQAMSGKTVTWSLKNPVTGVHIDSSTGEVKVRYNAVGSWFIVVATEIDSGTQGQTKRIVLNYQAM
ncbi:MAG: cell wall-binding repeat-containing protein [Desulfosporosinus sp.]|nr:cell wall-binding repeat-containing protein [Desulfosporosinus sp.]